MGNDEMGYNSEMAAKKKLFDYSKNYEKLDLRKRPELYRVGKGEQGVLLVEPYKSEILHHWRFKTPEIATKSAKAIYALFRGYVKKNDFVGMDMSRKFLQMGFTRARRYANHPSGKKYDSKGKVLPLTNDPIKAKAASIFKATWDKAERNPTYKRLKAEWKLRYG